MMRPGTLGVRVTGPLAEFVPGFNEELSRLGYTYLSARNQLRVMAHLSRWLAAQGLVPAEVTRRRLLEFLVARRNAGYKCWLSERGLGPLVNYLIGRKVIPAPEPVARTSPVDRRAPPRLPGGASDPAAGGPGGGAPG